MRARGIGKDGAADREPANQIKARRDLETCRQIGLGRIQSQDHDATAVAVMIFDRGDGIGPCRAGRHRFQLPPVGPDARAIELPDQVGRGQVIHRTKFRGNDLQQEFQPLTPRRGEKPKDLFFLRGAHPGCVVRMAVTQDLDHILARPFLQSAAIGAKLRFKIQRPRSGQFGGPPDP
jgi:hypothetical protein